MYKSLFLSVLLFSPLMPTAAATQGYNEAVIASYYADECNGRKTANGERFDNSKLTAAHRTLPFGTRVQVTYLKTGKSVVVRINDRGPVPKDRGIDLSKAAAAQIGMIQAGLGPVRLERLS